MMKRTATEEMTRLNMRRRRADSLAAAVLQRLLPRIDATHPDELPDRIVRLVHGALAEALNEQGVDVVTDNDRAEAGLPPRGPEGWTAEELWVLERKRLELLMAPIRIEIPRTFCARIERHELESK